jgi:hypothetical protein
VATPRPTRASWDELPDVVLHAPIATVKRHPDYDAAKSGDADAAVRLVMTTISADAVSAVEGFATA